jgi:triacylglycerol esterase/lipase EstA (alpha/beta hydrolase family)
MRRLRLRELSRLIGTRRLPVLALSATAVALTAPVAAQAALPVVYSSVAADAYASAHVNGPPPGANDWSCRLTAQHPHPVVLVPGTLENMAGNWYTLSSLLSNEGYCVFALNYGQEAGRVVGFPGALPPGGTGHIAASAGELAAFVERVLSATGAAKVDVVGHSQGGMMPRYYLKFLGGAQSVHALVGLSPSNHGTTVDGLTSLLALLPGGPQTGALELVCGPSCEEQFAGSAFMASLNDGGDTVPGVSYTVIETRYDEVVTPYTSAFLSGPRVTNIELQQQCALDASEHLATPFDHIALRDVLNALDPAHARAPSCGVVAPIVGG